MTEDNLVTAQNIAVFAVSTAAALLLSALMPSKKEKSKSKKTGKKKFLPLKLFVICLSVIGSAAQRGKLAAKTDEIVSKEQENEKIKVENAVLFNPEDI